MRDSKFFTPLWRASGKHIVVYYKNLGFKPDDEDFVIIDESDLLMNNHPGSFFSFMHKNNVICFNGAAG